MEKPKDYDSSSLERPEQKIFQDTGKLIMENKLTYKILAASDYDELYGLRNSNGQTI